MAITITQEPEEYSTASNPLAFSFSSTVTTNANFSFVVELYINGFINSTHQVFVQSGDRSKFDCSELVRATLSSPLILNTDLVQDYSSAYCTYQIKVFEKSGTPPVLDAGSGLLSSIVIAFNGALRQIDWINFNYLQYLPWNFNPFTTNQPYQFLTMFPRTELDFVGMNQEKFLGILSKTFQIEFKVNLIDINGVPVPGSLYSDTFLASQAVTVFNVGVQNIIAQTTITQAMFDLAHYYTIQFDDADIQGTTQGASESYKLYIDRDCERYTWTRLHWLNKYGIWDAYTFKMISADETSVQQDTYQSTRGTWDASNEWSFPLSQGEAKSFGTRAKDTLTINSDWISETLQNWLVRSLIESPKVFIEQPEGFERCVVSTKKYKLKTRKVDRLIQETIQIERTYSYNSQID